MSSLPVRILLASVVAVDSATTGFLGSRGKNLEKRRKWEISISEHWRFHFPFLMPEVQDFLCTSLFEFLGMHFQVSQGIQDRKIGKLTADLMVL